MSISKIARAIPLLALGIACSTSQTQSKDHTGAMWTERDGTPHASTESTASSGSDASQATSSPADSGAAAATAAPSESSEAMGTEGVVAASGSSDQGSQMGSSESMGAASPSGSTGSGQGSMGGGGGAADQGAAMGSGGSSVQSVKGKVSKISSDEITITPKSGTAKTLKIGTDTHVTINGKDAKPSQLKAGQPVRASYMTQGSDVVATQIVVSSSKQGHKASNSKAHPSGSTGSSSGSSGSSGGTQ